MHKGLGSNERLRRRIVFNAAFPALWKHVRPRARTDISSGDKIELERFITD